MFTAVKQKRKRVCLKDFSVLDTVITFFVSGIVFGAVYDFFRFFRLVFKSKSVVFIIDFLYFVIVSIVFFILLLGYNNGMIRSYFVILTLLGFLTYIFTAFRFTLKIQKPAAIAVRKLFKKILQFIQRMYIMFLSPVKRLFCKKKEVKPDSESVFSEAEGK